VLIQTQEVALDFIGKRGATPSALKEDRMRYAGEILRKEMLPHMGRDAYETRKAYFLGRFACAL